MGGIPTLKLQHPATLIRIKWWLMDEWTMLGLNYKTVNDCVCVGVFLIFEFIF